MAIVGWNDNVQTPGGTGAWIIRNSWGASDDQHVGISYNDFYTGNDTPDTGACNAAAVSFHNVVPNTYQQIYYYNLFGWTDQQPSAYAFNHFTADQSGLLKSVSFYTTDDNVGYTVNVYEQFQSGVLGQLAATISGTEELRGLSYHRPAPAWCPLAQGQDFYIELKTSNGQQANDGDISWQQLLDFQNSTGTAMTTSLPGQSFYSANGSNWTDLYSVDSTHSENFAIDGLTIVQHGDGLGHGRQRKLERGGQLAGWHCTQRPDDRGGHQCRDDGRGDDYARRPADNRHAGAGQFGEQQCRLHALRQRQQHVDAGQLRQRRDDYRDRRRARYHAPTILADNLLVLSGSAIPGR